MAPDPACRPAGDVDVLVPDADTAWNHLRSLGWELSEEPLPQAGDSLYYPPWHWHAPPLVPPGGGVTLEVHRAAQWSPPLTRMGRGAPVGDLVDRAQGADLPFPGVLVPDTVDHALVVAGAAFGGHTYERLSQLADLWLLVAACGDPSAVAARAHTYGLGRLWTQVWGAANSQFGHGRPPASFLLLGGWLRRGTLPTKDQQRWLRFASMPWVSPPGAVASVALETAVRRLRQFRGRRG